MKKHVLVAFLFATPILAMVASNAGAQQRLQATTQATQAKRLTEADRKVTAGQILLKWGGYVEKVNGQNRRAWAAALWPSLATADLDNLQKASRAVTYEGMRNALLGQRPGDDHVIDRMARLPRSSGVTPKVLGSLVGDLVFTPILPCRIVDTRNIGGRMAANETRDLNAANAGGNFTLQGGSDTDCGIPANPAALALSVTGLNNLTTGYLRVYPFDGTSAQGSPVPVPVVNTTVTNDMIVPTCQGCAQELKVFSTANTHYAAFVTGYFMAPEATALDCQDLTTDASATTVADNAVFQLRASTCPVGYSSTGMNCYVNTYQADVFLLEVEPDHPDYRYCTWQNKTGADLNPGAFPFKATNRCCRIPGR